MGNKENKFSLPQNQTQSKDNEKCRKIETRRDKLSFKFSIVLRIHECVNKKY